MQSAEFRSKRNETRRTSYDKKRIRFRSAAPNGGDKEVKASISDYEPWSNAKHRHLYRYRAGLLDDHGARAAPLGCVHEWLSFSDDDSRSQFDLRCQRGGRSEGLRPGDSELPHEWIAMWLIDVSSGSCCLGIGFPTWADKCGSARCFQLSNRILLAILKRSLIGCASGKPLGYGSRTFSACLSAHPINYSCPPAAARHPNRDRQNIATDRTVSRSD